jgi:hypothetical protein
VFSLVMPPTPRLTGSGILFLPACLTLSMFPSQNTWTLVLLYSNPAPLLALNSLLPLLLGTLPGLPCLNPLEPIERPLLMITTIRPLFLLTILTALLLL